MLKSGFFLPNLPTDLDLMGLSKKPLSTDFK
jgi:hypothetical protein